MDKMRFTITRMTLDDLDEVMELERELFTTPWTEGVFEDELFRDTAVDYVARDPDGSLVGYVCLRVFMDEAHVLNLAVRRDSRRRGVGTALVVRALVKADRLGARSATLEVRGKNLEAIALYGSIGFVTAGKRRGYYDRPKDDALIMWLYDIASAVKKALAV